MARWSDSETFNLKESHLTSQALAQRAQRQQEAWWMTNEHEHEKNASISPKFREGYIVLFECLLIGQQSAKHPSIQHVTL